MSKYHSYKIDQLVTSLRFIATISHRQIGLDISDVSVLPLNWLIMQRIFNISKRYLQKLTLAGQKEIQHIREL